MDTRGWYHHPRLRTLSQQTVGMDLKSLYYDPRTGLSSLNAFYIRAKELGFSRKEVASFLAKQDAFQVNKQQLTTPYFPIWGEPFTYQADTLDMGVKEYHGWRYILNIININTRQAWALPCKKKSQETGLLLDWFKDHKVKVFQVDLGSEFSTKIDNYCQKHDIILRKVRKGESTDQGKVERFNGTLRRLITMYCSVFKTDDWVTDLPKLLENYNSRYCAPIGMAPKDATEETSRHRNLAQYLNAQHTFDQFAIGERVRKLIHKSSTFVKGKKRWSQEIYIITDIRNHEFELNGSTWVKSWEVQPIPDDSPEAFEVPDKRVDEAVVRKTRKVTRSIVKEGILPYNNQGEQEAPASEKRQVRVRETYVAQPSNLKELKARRAAEQAKVKRQGERVPKYVQKFVKGKWVRGRVFDDLRIKFLDGSSGEYSRDLIKSKSLYKFPLDQADKKVYPELAPQLDTLT